MMHQLNVDPNAKPVAQKQMSFNTKRNQVIAREVIELLKAGFIHEVYYPQWLSNVVMVKKLNGKWRMRVDFIDLNKACPKNSFPLRRIDQLVDATAGHEMLSFMDVYSGYNQLRMYEPDQEKTSFITEQEECRCYLSKVSQ